MRPKGDRAPKMYIGRAVRGRWAWHCYFCSPPAYGSTKSFERTVKNALAHLKHRKMHHEWALRKAKP